MSLAAGAVSSSNIQARSATVKVADATGGTAPYTYQWYKSTTSGFSPGGGNIITGATNQTLNDSGLVPGTKYYYKNIVTDSAGSPATATSGQLEVDTLADSPSLNQLAQTPVLGMTDMEQDQNTLACQIDAAESTTLAAGQAVKMATTAGAGAPKILAATAASDKILGFITYSFKKNSYAAGDMCEVACEGDIVRLMATAAINRGQGVTSLPSAVAGGTVGGVAPVTGSSGLPVAGWSLDTVTPGQLARIKLLARPASPQLDS